MVSVERGVANLLRALQRQIWRSSSLGSLSDIHRLALNADTVTEVGMADRRHTVTATTQRRFASSFVLFPKSPFCAQVDSATISELRPAVVLTPGLYDGLNQTAQAQTQTGNFTQSLGAISASLADSQEPAASATNSVTG